MSKSTDRTTRLLTAIAAALAACHSAFAQPLNAEEARAIAIESYIYMYPLISMEVTREITTNVPAGVKPGMGPMNSFHHMRAFPTAEFRAVVRPNFDTLYSSCWLDLTGGPVILSAPQMDGRYHLLPILDMWSNVIAVPGTRTSGNAAGNWAIVPPGWTGELPAGVEPIQATTSHLWIIGRTQTNGPKDYPAVNALQDGYRVTPLSAWGKPAQPEAAPAPDPSIDMKTDPLTQVNTMPAAKYFDKGARLMKLNPPQATDWSQIRRMKRLGIEPGKPFDINALPADIRAIVEESPKLALGQMRAHIPQLAPVVNGWQLNVDSMGVYGNFYLKRAIIALVGLGANQPEDAIYPLNITDSDGKPMVGEGLYVMHFPKDQLPPVNGFWSITMYDEEGFQVANKLDRFAIGDRDQLKYNPDGSLDIYMQHESPGADKESNWLPSPRQGKLGVTMRLYAPKSPALTGQWVPPAIKRVQ